MTHCIQRKQYDPFRILVRFCDHIGRGISHHFHRNPGVVVRVRPLPWMALGRSIVLTTQIFFGDTVA